MTICNKYNTEGAGILSSVVWSEGLIKLELNTQTIKVNDKLQFFHMRIKLCEF